MSSPILVWGPLVALTAIFFSLLVVFSVQVVRHGLPKNPRAAGLGSAILGQYFLEYGLWLFKPVAGVAVKLRLHPDHLSWASLILQLMAAYFIGQGAMALGGWLLLIGAACDSLDGTVARARGLASDAGEVLDAVIDRWAEMAVCFGFAWYYRDFAPGFVLALWACAASVMVSYTRAKGETLDIDAKMGLMNRHERAAYLITATVFSAFAQLKWPQGNHPRHDLVLGALFLIASMGTWTAIRRTAFMRAELRKR